MPSPTPLDSLFTLADAILPLAPHNVLASLFAGGALGPQTLPPAGMELKKYSKTSGKAVWSQGGMSVRMKSGGAKITVTAPQDAALVLSIQRLKRAIVEKRSGPVPQLAPLQKSLIESDADYIPKEPPIVVIIGPEHQTSFDDIVKKSDVSEEKGPLGVVVLKKTTTDYAIDVALTGVMYKQVEVGKGAREEEERRRRRRG